MGFESQIGHERVIKTAFIADVALTRKRVKLS